MKTEDWVIYRPYTNQEDFEHAVRLWNSILSRFSRKQLAA